MPESRHHFARAGRDQARIEEGRRTFANTLKYVLITTSANLGNMVSTAAAAVFVPFCRWSIARGSILDHGASRRRGDQVRC